MTPTHRQLLEPHAKRKIRAFIVAPDPGNHRDSNVFDAFWSLIYGGEAAAVDHSTAVAVEKELLTTNKRVGDLLDGWRPTALSWTEPAPGGDA